MNCQQVNSLNKEYICLKAESHDDKEKVCESFECKIPVVYKYCYSY